MKYKIEIYAVESEGWLLDEGDGVAIYCLYKKESIFSTWSKVYRSRNLEQLIDIGNKLKDFQTIYL